MKYISDFNFLSNISVFGYTSKSEATKAFTKRGKGKYCFYLQNLTPSELLEYLITGHGYTSVVVPPNEGEWTTNNRGISYKVRYYLTGKYAPNAISTKAIRDDFFKQSSCIFVDIDETKIKSVPDYIQRLKLIPTLAYTSFSYTEETKKFRLVYIFDTPFYTIESFKATANKLCKIIEVETGEEMKDKCWTSPTQLMHGTYNPKFSMCTDAIYSVSDIDELADSYNIISVGPLFGEDVVIEKRGITVLSAKESAETIVFDSDLINSAYNCEKTGDIGKFAGLNSRFQWISKHPNARRNVKFNQDGSLEKIDYIPVSSLTPNQRIVITFPKSKKIQKGNRHSFLKTNAALRRFIMDDQVTPNWILFNILMDYFIYVEKESEGDIMTVDDCISVAKYISKLTMPEIFDKFKDEITCQTRRFFIGNNTSRERVSELKHEFYSEKISAEFDSKLTVEENCKKIGVSKKTMIKWMKENSLTKQTKSDIENRLEVIKANFNPDVSVTENFKVESIINLGVSIKTYRRDLKKLNLIP